jgi:hypothetical protein
MSAWEWLPRGYLLTVLIETPVLLAALSPIHSFRRRLFAGLWLTACSYPMVVLAMSRLPYPWYPWAAEGCAPLLECLLFAAAFGDGRGWRSRSLWRDCAAIVAANLASFAVGWRLWWAS